MFHSFGLSHKNRPGFASMRTILTALILACMTGLASLPALADPGMAAERVSRAGAVDDGHGAVIISIRSELYLDDPLQVYFLREGGSIANDRDVVRFERRQGFFAFGNDTVEYQIRAYQLAPGTYRLVAHGMNCPKVPAEDERCLIDVQGIAGAEVLSRPSRGYGEDAPSFEVRAGSLTDAGDFALTARNTIEWSPIPAHEIDRARRGFARLPMAPAPEVPEDFKLKYGLHARTFEDDRYRRY